MTRNQFIKQLSLNLLFTFLVSSFLTFLVIEIFYSKEADSLEGSQGVFIMVLAGICWSLILAICSLTVFFNLNDKIKRNRFYSFLSFYLVPALVAIIVFIESDSRDMINSFLIMTIPFFIVQSYFFIKFTKNKLMH